MKIMLAIIKIIIVKQSSHKGGAYKLAKKLMSKEIVLFDVEAQDRDEVIGIIADAMEADGRLIDKYGYINDVFKREKGASTAIGFHIATPHAKSTNVKEASLAFVRLRNNVMWDEEDQVNMIFQIGVPSPGPGERHLEILATLFKKIMHEDFRKQLFEAKTADEVIALVGNI